MIYNETINAARLGLIDAIKSVKEFDSSLTDEHVAVLIQTILSIEGVPDPNKDWHNQKLYDRVRKILRRSF